MKHNQLIRKKSKLKSYKGKISCSIGHHANISQTLILELASLGMQRPVIAPFPIGKDCPLTQLCDESHSAPNTSGSCEIICQNCKNYNTNNNGSKIEYTSLQAPLL